MMQIIDQHENWLDRDVRDEYDAWALECEAQQRQYDLDTMFDDCPRTIIDMTDEALWVSSGYVESDESIIDRIHAGMPLKGVVLA